MNFYEVAVPLDALLLDPNNYRFQEDPNFVAADPSRFHEPGAQDRAYRRLREDGLVQLKNSILKNGFLPVERIIVRKYSDEPEKFLVVEGNRRVAALKWIAEDHQAGVPVPADVLKNASEVDVLVVEATEEFAGFFEALMGIRHVSGIKEWGGFQRAKLVAALKDEYQLDSSEVGDRLGLTTQEVNRRYKAFKALQQMQTDEEVAEYAHPDMYPMFHEAVSLPIVRDWLGWDESNNEFRNEDARALFYSLITPLETEEGKREPKVSTFSQVRELRHVLAKPEAKIVLADPSRTFLDALTVARRDELSHTWKAQAVTVIAALQSISITDLRAMTPEEIGELEKLRDAAVDLLESRKRLTEG